MDAGGVEVLKCNITAWENDSIISSVAAGLLQKEAVIPRKTALSIFFSKLPQTTHA